MKLKPNCVGKFQVAVSALEEGWRDIAGAMPAMVVLNVEHDWEGDVVTYTAASVHFDQLNEGEQIPMYRMNFMSFHGVICFAGAERIIVGRGMV